MKVEYTSLFMQAFDDLVSCGHHFFSQQTLKNLINEIQRSKRLLTNQPYIGGEEPILEGMEPRHRHIIIKPYFKLIYTIFNDTLFFVDIWDTRRDPDELSNRVNQTVP